MYINIIIIIVAGCKTYLEQGRYTWRHNSILNFLATSLKAVNESIIYADIPGFLSPSIITGENLRPDLLLRTNNNYLYILELTVGFESNLEKNATRNTASSMLLSYLVYSGSSNVPPLLIFLWVLLASAIHSSKCVTLSPSISTKNSISFLNFPTSPSVLRTTYFVAKISQGQIRNYTLFNFSCFILFFSVFPFTLRLL